MRLCSSIVIACISVASALLWVPDPALAKEPLLCSDPVMTAYGAVSGHDDGAVCAYKAIPYAAPPIDDLRWRAPEPPATWSGIRDGSEFPPRCSQKSVMELVNFDPSGESSEDCLYLNIWRPKGDGPFPVFVWIHGGGLFGGTANTPIYHGQHLADAGQMVVVTMNYRLSIFGFLATPGMSEEDPNGSAGNYGILDQVEALKWVQGNIHEFGGDKDRVTLGGESAGGWSVCTLMASPLGEGLFHQAIMESGGCQAATSLERGFEIGERVAEALGCDPGDLDCMRSKPTGKVLRRGVQSELKGFDWLPRVDGHVLEDTPLGVIGRGAHHQVPFLAGGNRDEAGVIVALRPAQYFHADGRYGARLERQFGEGIGSTLSQLYSLEQYRRPIRAYRQIATDVAIFCPSVDGLRMAAQSEPQSFLYRFDYDDFRFGGILGAPHGFELPFVFGNLPAMPTGPVFWGGRQQRRAAPLSEAMMTYWSNFIWTGDPNGEGLTPWPSFGETGAIQLLDKEILSSPMESAVAERCDFWRSYAGSHPELAETLGFTFGGPELTQTAISPHAQSP